LPAGHSRPDDEYGGESLPAEGRTTAGTRINHGNLALPLNPLRASDVAQRFPNRNPRRTFSVPLCASHMGTAALAKELQFQKELLHNFAHNGGPLSEAQLHTLTKFPHVAYDAANGLLHSPTPRRPPTCRCRVRPASASRSPCMVVWAAGETTGKAHRLVLITLRQPIMENF
jgi:hypothetical protein